MHMDVCNFEKISKTCFPCADCPKKYVKYRRLVQHAISTHNVELISAASKKTKTFPSTVCLTCKKTYYASRDAKVYHKKHCALAKCDLCDFECRYHINTSDQNFTRHTIPARMQTHLLKQHTAILKKTFKCAFCPKIFKNFLNRARHEECHRLVRRCPVCRHYFPTYSMVVGHLKTVHNENNTNSNPNSTSSVTDCEHCGKVMNCRNFRQLSKHIELCLKNPNRKK